MSPANPVLELAPGWRYRCFGPLSERRSPCARQATRRGVDRRRHDALTFWCDGCAPKDTELIDDHQPFIELAIAGLVVLPGATTRHDDALAEGVFAVQAALAKIGAAFTVVDGRLALRTPVPIIRGNGS